MKALGTEEEEEKETKAHTLLTLLGLRKTPPKRPHVRVYVKRKQRWSADLPTGYLQRLLRQGTVPGTWSPHLLTEAAPLRQRQARGVYWLRNPGAWLHGGHHGHRSTRSHSGQIGRAQSHHSQPGALSTAAGSRGDSEHR